MSECLNIIPDTYIMCGEGGNFCSDACLKKALELDAPPEPSSLMTASQAANECMAYAAESNNIWVALVAQNCALRIRRKMGNWE